MDGNITRHYGQNKSQERKGQEKAKVFAAVLFLFFVAGCATTRPDTTKEFNDVKSSISAYSKCIDAEVRPLLSSKETPGDIADAVSYRCENYLTQYRKDVTSYLTATISEGSRTQYEVLMIEPDRRVENLREKAKRATISRVLAYRDPSFNSSR